MMKNARNWCYTPPSVTVWVKPNNTSHSLQIKRGHRIKRANSQCLSGKGQPNQRRCKMYCTKMTKSPTVVIQPQEMASFFSLFDDDLIQDFLWMDRCCKMTDKYLLAMTFVYFKRANFTIAEYTKKNLFIALYLANTMEEDEEESKYEIFPWALGRNWRKQFPYFLKQRDELWTRIQYRAAVSRQCCEEVMAIVPSHFVWQRKRSEHHSGAQRQYGDQPLKIPRGPSASPVLCSLCNLGSKSNQGPGSSSFLTVPTPQNLNPVLFTSTLALETTPPRALCKKAVETKIQAQHSSCGCVKVPKDKSPCGSMYDTSMDWINEE